VLSIRRGRTSIAVEVSGASRGTLPLHRFSKKLLEHALLPALESTDFDAYVWLDTKAAESDLCSLLTTALRICESRHEKMLDTEDEAASIAAEHPPSRFGGAWRTDTTPNTMRMLYKLRGVERFVCGSKSRQFGSGPCC
jgi:hypothetical protein